MKTNHEDNTVNTIEEQAWAWIIKIEADSPPAEEDILALHRWMSQSPEHHQTLKRLAKGWDKMSALTALAVPVKPRLGLSRVLVSAVVWLLAPVILLFSILQQSAQLLEQSSRSLQAVAATTLVTLGLGVVFIVQTGMGQATYITAVGEQSTYTLPDGSTLWLNTNSEVAIHYSESKRLITLRKGEAHFDVVPDKARHFEVFAGTRMVRAVGTAFTVFLDQARVEVTVSEGKVDLGVVAEPAANSTQSSPATAKPELLGSLVAGQSAAIPAGKQGVMSDIAQIEKQQLKRRLSWLEGQLIYAGESLDTVVKDVSRYTPVYIELVDDSIKAIRIGGQFQVGETEALFRVLEVGFGLQVSRLSDHHVQIHAPQ